VYDKLGVADRLELALYCLNHRVVENAAQAKTPAATPTNGHAPEVTGPSNTAAAAAAASGSHS